MHIYTYVHIYVYIYVYIYKYIYICIYLNIIAVCRSLSTLFWTYEQARIFSIQCKWLVLSEKRKTLQNVNTLSKHHCRLSLSLCPSLHVCILTYPLNTHLYIRLHLYMRSACHGFFVFANVVFANVSNVSLRSVCQASRQTCFARISIRDSAL